jgi:uncharacterized protein YggE
MKKLVAWVSVLFAAGCLPLGEPSQIIVDGQSSLEFEPDTFSLYAELQARGESQAVALAQVSKTLASIRETLPDLEGLTNLTINANAAEITPVRDVECLEKANYGNEEQCLIEGYVASISLGITGSPAKVSGRTLSLVSELGASRVRLGGYSLAEPAQAEKEAMDSAFKDAQAKAEKIAAASRLTIVGPIRIQHGAGFPDQRYGADYYMQARSPGAPVAPGARVVTPETDLDLAPQPIRIEARIVAAFEIE